MAVTLEIKELDYTDLSDWAKLDEASDKQLAEINASLLLKREFRSDKLIAILDQNRDLVTSRDELVVSAISGAIKLFGLTHPQDGAINCAKYGFANNLLTTTEVFELFKYERGGLVRALVETAANGAEIALYVAGLIAFDARDHLVISILETYQDNPSEIFHLRSIDPRLSQIIRTRLEKMLFEPDQSHQQRYGDVVLSWLEGGDTPFAFIDQPSDRVEYINILLDPDRQRAAGNALSMVNADEYDSSKVINSMNEKLRNYDADFRSVGNLLFEFYSKLNSDELTSDQRNFLLQTILEVLEQFNFSDVQNLFAPEIFRFIVDPANGFEISSAEDQRICDIAIRCIENADCWLQIAKMYLIEENTIVHSQTSIDKIYEALLNRLDVQETSDNAVEVCKFVALDFTHGRRSSTQSHSVKDGLFLSHVKSTSFVNPVDPAEVFNRLVAGLPEDISADTMAYLIAFQEALNPGERLQDNIIEQALRQKNLVAAVDVYDELLITEMYHGSATPEDILAGRDFQEVEQFLYYKSGKYKGDRKGYLSVVSLLLTDEPVFSESTTPSVISGISEIREALLPKIREICEAILELSSVSPSDFLQILRFTWPHVSVNQQISAIQTSVYNLLKDIPVEMWHPIAKFLIENGEQAYSTSDPSAVQSEYKTWLEVRQEIRISIKKKVFNNIETPSAIDSALNLGLATIGELLVLNPVGATVAAISHGFSPTDIKESLIEQIETRSGSNLDILSDMVAPSDLSSVRQAVANSISSEPYNWPNDLRLVSFLMENFAQFNDDAAREFWDENRPKDDLSGFYNKLNNDEFTEESRAAQILVEILDSSRVSTAFTGSPEPSGRQTVVSPVTSENETNNHNPNRLRP